MNHALDSFDGGDGKLLSFQGTRGEPVAVTIVLNPVNLNGALGGDDGCSLWLLFAVEFNGRDACHKQEEPDTSVKMRLAL